MRILQLKKTIQNYEGSLIITLIFPLNKVVQSNILQKKFFFLIIHHLYMLLSCLLFVIESSNAMIE